MWTIPLQSLPSTDEAEKLDTIPYLPFSCPGPVCSDCSTGEPLMCSITYFPFVPCSRLNCLPLTTLLPCRSTFCGGLGSGKIALSNTLLLFEWARSLWQVTPKNLVGSRVLSILQKMGDLLFCRVVPLDSPSPPWSPGHYGRDITGWDCRGWCITCAWRDWMLW